MSELFLVQDDLRVPQNRRGQKQPRRKFPVDDMQPGQQFFVPGKKSKTVSAYISRITKTLPGKYTARQDWARPVAMIGDKRKWESCEPTDDGATDGVTVARVE